MFILLTQVQAVLGEIIETPTYVNLTNVTYIVPFTITYYASGIENFKDRTREQPCVCISFTAGTAEEADSIFVKETLDQLSKMLPKA